MTVTGAVLPTACTGAWTHADPEPAAIWFGGDVHVGATARGGLTDIRAMVGHAVGVVNLEGPIADGEGYARVTGAGLDEKVDLANPAESGRFLAANGVLAASVANNHAHDGGDRSEPRTIRELRRADVEPFGGDAGHARVKVGHFLVALYAHDLGEDDVVGQIRRELGAPDPSTVRVETFHVTGPPSYLPTAALVAAVDEAAHDGADIVVAHGTHVIGPIERRGQTVIAWGLGNLLFDCTCTDKDEAVILRVSLESGHPAEIIPVRAGLGGAPASLATDPAGILDLLEAIGSSPLRKGPKFATF